MARLAYIMLCHQNPAAIIRQATLLTSQGDSLAIHVDGRARSSVFEAVRNGLATNANVVMAKRVNCGWGEWSLIQATLNAVRAAVKAFPFTTHFYLVSGDCMPIRSAANIHDYLDEIDADQIASKDFFESDWIKTGLKEDRLNYRHWFNERRNKWLFYKSLDVQKWLRLARQPPAGMEIRIGSQWWCLRRGTIERILEFVGKRKDVVRYFRTTWIPDETFFQTLVYHLVAEIEIVPHPPTFLLFSDYGMPVTFYADHFDYLTSQNALFARKISNRAHKLHNRLADLFASQNAVAKVGTNGADYFSFVTNQGRIGGRFGPRFWEFGQTLGAGILLNVIVCKKWHVALRLAQQLHDSGGPKNYGYVFDNERTDLPAMGGYENSRVKRVRHRRAFLKTLAQQEATDRMTICLDTSNVAALADLAGDDCTLHVLEIGCKFSDDYVIDHADRIGLNGSQLLADAQSEMVAAIRRIFAEEKNAVRKLNLPAMFRINVGDEPAEIAEVLAGFAGIHPKRALFIAEEPALFE